MIVGGHCLQSPSCTTASSRALAHHKLGVTSRNMRKPFSSAQINGPRCVSESIVEGRTLHERPSANDLLTLYTHTLCPYAQRTYTTLHCKQVQHKTIHIDLSHKPSWFSLVNRKDLVPALEYQGQVHTESIDICKWIDQSFDGPDLQSSNPQTDTLISSCNSFASAGLDFLAGTTGRSWGIGTGQSKAQQASFQQHLDKFASQLGKSGGPFLLGKRVTLADLIYMPFMERFALALPEFAGFSVSEACGGSIGSWLGAMQQLECCQMAAADPELLLNAFRKHKSLDFFDFERYTATQLHPHLELSLEAAA